MANGSKAACMRNICTPLICHVMTGKFTLGMMFTKLYDCFLSTMVSKMRRKFRNREVEQYLGQRQQSMYK